MKDRHDDKSYDIPFKVIALIMIVVFMWVKV